MKVMIDVSYIRLTPLGIDAVLYMNEEPTAALPVQLLRGGDVVFTLELPLAAIRETKTAQDGFLVKYEFQQPLELDIHLFQDSLTAHIPSLKQQIGLDEHRLIDVHGVQALASALGGGEELDGLDLSSMQDLQLLEAACERKLKPAFYEPMSPAFPLAAEVTIPPIVRAKIRNAKILLPHGIVVAGEQFAIDANPYNILRRPGIFRVNNKALWHDIKPDMRVETAKCLIDAGHQNYYHWLIGIFSRMNYFGRPENTSDTYLSGPLHSGFQSYFMKKAGLSPEQLLVPPPGTRVVEVDELDYVNTPGFPAGMAAGALAFLQDIVGDEQDYAFKRPAKIYITRRGIDKRPIANEQEIARLMAANGFVEVQPEYLSPLEQARVFASAEVIVAQSGAALTNLVFCKKLQYFIELFADAPMGAHIANMWRCLADQTGAQHTAILAMRIGQNSERSQQNLNKGRYYVDMDDLSGALKHI